MFHLFIVVGLWAATPSAPDAVPRVAGVVDTEEEVSFDEEPLARHTAAAASETGPWPWLVILPAIVLALAARNVRWRATFKHGVGVAARGSAARASVTKES